MELHNDQVPGDTVWAMVSDFGGGGGITADWYLTAETSSEDYRATVIYMKTHSGGTCTRFKVTLPRPRMHVQEVSDYVMDKLVTSASNPDGTTQLLDISVQSGKE